ncbi:helix-turn-helix transcriptional regulator [Fusobacterium nucleatum]|uniref:helix-turn-helix domain-containing protein n=1 Tax=Fusobacterium nucleatum TaxID=851 RepID=UPI0030CE1357
MNTADIIKKRREELGLSQEELAVKLGYKSRSSINKIELGLSDIPFSKIPLFAKALEIEPEVLMGWEARHEIGHILIHSEENDIFSRLTEEELSKLEKFKNMSTVMFMNEGNDISDKDKETLATAYAEVLISQRKK